MARVLKSSGVPMNSPSRSPRERLDDATTEMFDALVGASAAKVGVGLIQARVMALALASLAEEWP